MVHRVATKVANLELSATDEVDNIVKRMQRSGINDIISLGGGEPCFDTPQNIQEAALRALRGGKTKYEPTTGDYELRVELSKKLERENRIDATADDIIVRRQVRYLLGLSSGPGAGRSGDAFGASLGILQVYGPTGRCWSCDC